jgi:hypothetical protein
MRNVLGVLIAAAALSGCASFHQLSSTVSSYSLWPAGRQPATYTFERLPSQQAHAPQQQMLEEAAHRALESAGFKLAADPQAADVTVTLGARVTATDPSPYDSPFWWHGGLWRHGFYGPPYRGFGGFGGFGYRYGFPYETPVYEREVALLMRDRRSAQPLYEVRVTNDGYSPSMGMLLGAMFEAGMKDFPQGLAAPHRVVTPLASP